MHSTDSHVSPSSYSPEQGNRLRKERDRSGVPGAQSYPFSSTDRRMRQNVQTLTQQFER